MKVIKIIGKILGFIILAFLIILAISFSIIAYQTSRSQIDYQEQIYEYSNKYNVDPMLTAAIIKVESDFDNSAKSHQNAKGLMQLLEDTARHSAEVTGIEYFPERLEDVDYNLNLGVSYYKYLYKYYNNQELALAAYNGGVGNVDDWIKDGTLDKNDPNILDIPFDETRAYVTKVDSTYDVYKKFYKDQLPTKDQLSNLKELSIRNFKIFISDLINNLS